MVHQCIPLRRPGHSDIKAEPRNANPVKPAPDSGAVPLPAWAASLVGGEENRPYCNWSNFSVAIRTLESRLIDDSAYRDVSLGRETSVIFTSTGPVVYRFIDRRRIFGHTS